MHRKKVSPLTVEKQDPTSANGYTWYRKYKSGWIEQGGCLLNAATGAHTITIPIEMASVEALKKSVIVTPIYISGAITKDKDCFNHFERVENELKKV